MTGEQGYLRAETMRAFVNSQIRTNTMTSSVLYGEGNAKLVRSQIPGGENNLPHSSFHLATMLGGQAHRVWSRGYPPGIWHCLLRSKNSIPVSSQLIQVEVCQTYMTLKHPCKGFALFHSRTTEMESSSCIAGTVTVLTSRIIQVGEILLNR